MEISNLEQREKYWKKERANWLKSVVPMFIIIGILTCSVLSYLMQYLPLLMSELNQNQQTAFDELERSWFSTGVFLGLFLSGPGLYMTYPKKPSQSDVDADVSLRKAFNMDTSVSDNVSKEAKSKKLSLLMKSKMKMIERLRGQHYL